MRQSAIDRSMDGRSGDSQLSAVDTLSYNLVFAVSGDHRHPSGKVQDGQILLGLPGAGARNAQREASLLLGSPVPA